MVIQFQKTIFNDDGGKLLKVFDTNHWRDERPMHEIIEGTKKNFVRFVMLEFNVAGTLSPVF